MILVVCVALAGAVGAPARFALDGFIQRRAESTLPVGTLVINLAGAFLLGLAVGAASHLSPTLDAAIGAGFCGAFTTFSTFSFESVRLAEEAAWRPLTLYLTITVAGGLAAAAAGLALADLL
jgi:fluoride exporter